MPSGRCLTLHPFVSGRLGPSRALARLLDHAIDLGDVGCPLGDRPRRPDRALVAGARDGRSVVARLKARPDPSTAFK